MMRLLILFFVVVAGCAVQADAPPKAEEDRYVFSVDTLANTISILLHERVVPRPAPPASEWAMVLQKTLPDTTDVAAYMGELTTAVRREQEAIDQIVGRLIARQNTLVLHQHLLGEYLDHQEGQ